MAGMEANHVVAGASQRVARRVERGEWARWAWPVAIFLVGLAMLLAVALRLIDQLAVTGDEPWYLLQSYALAHFHTPDLAPVLRQHTLYQLLLGTRPDDHTFDYLGNGERMLTYLPGYAALIALPYALGGRALVVILQAVAAAATGLLVYGEAQRLFRSRLIGLVAWLAFLVPLPVALYAGQVFPSTFAACATFLGYVATTRWLPESRGWRLLAVSALSGLLAVALPWLHIKYALAGLALAGIALVALLGPGARSGDGARSAFPAIPVSGNERRIAAALLACIVILGFGLIAVYSRHYFGAWTPPNARQQANLAHTRLDAVGVVYADMFLGPESGLLPWVPLDLLVVPGVVLLWRRFAWQGRAIPALLVAQLGIFVTAAFSSVSQARALPARFTLECAPFFALCVAAVVVRLLPEGGPRALWQALLRAAQRASRRDALGWRRVARGVALAGVCVLFLVTVEFAAVGRSDPTLLYPNTSGPRLAEKDPNLLPAWWFGLFPKLPGQWVTNGTAVLAPVAPGGVVVRGTDGAVGVRGAPGTVTPGTPLARSAAFFLPPGTYQIAFVVGCDPATSAGVAARLGVTHDYRAPPFTTRTLQLAQCQGVTQTATKTLRLASNGYQPLTFEVDEVGATTVVVWPVTYMPV